MLFRSPSPGRPRLPSSPHVGLRRQLPLIPSHLDPILSTFYADARSGTRATPASSRLFCLTPVASPSSRAILASPGQLLTDPRSCHITTPTPTRVAVIFQRAGLPASPRTDPARPQPAPPTTPGSLPPHRPGASPALLPPEALQVSCSASPCDLSGVGWSGRCSTLRLPARSIIGTRSPPTFLSRASLQLSAGSASR